MARALAAERQREAKAFARSRNRSHEQSHQRNVVGVRVLAAGLRKKPTASHLHGINTKRRTVR
jgi:hypothetical protein